jgi:hypothetical protein
MPLSTKTLTLMSFQDSYNVTQRDPLFQIELNWLFLKTGIHPSDALFISYAFKGSNYPAFFQQVTDVFAKAGITLVDITTGDPASLIGSAKMIVMCGGDTKSLLDKLNSMITATFNPYDAIKNRIYAGIPFIGWNQGSSIVSPKYFAPPSSLLSTAINVSPFQIICGYPNDPQSDAAILNFLNTSSIKKVIGQPATAVKDESSVRLEETGGGMIDSTTSPYPIVIHYTAVGGKLIKS